MVRKCSKVICKKDLYETDINTLSLKLGEHLNEQYQKNGFYDIIVMMLQHKLPHERYFTKTHKHHHNHY